MADLSIKNERTVKLVRELAAMKGVSLVTAVTLAVQDKITQIKAEQQNCTQSKVSRYDRLMTFANEFSRRVPNPIHSWEIDGLLYGDDGLPK
jgi:hypothetical protein